MMIEIDKGDRVMKTWIKANYEIVEQTDELVCIRDVGPWDKFASVTNAAEEVVKELAPVLKGRRLEYFDSDGNRDQLLVKDGQFAGFAPVGKRL